MKRNRAKNLIVLSLILSLLIPVYALASDKVNLNHATCDELTQLKGIGPVIAQKIVDYRETYGPFKKIEDLMKVNGIGPKIFEGIREQITVEQSKV